VNIYEQGQIIDLAAELTHRQLSWKEKIALVGSEFLQRAQIDCPVEHIFRDGNYIRRMSIPQGTLFIGRPHKIGHRCQLDKGSLIQFTEHGRIERNPGDSVQSTPGYQVILYAVTDVVGSTVHPDSGERDIDKLEDAIFESKQDFAELGMTVRKALEAKV
jgi:hypothetical protein